MSDDRAKRGRYKPGNTDADGNYITGKNRTPEHTRFRTGDGRARGQRKKGTANLDTDFLAEASATIEIKENGKTVRIAKQRALVKKAFDRAFNGSDAALREVLTRLRSVADRQAEQQGRNLPMRDREIIDQFLKDMQEGLGVEFSDTTPPLEAEGGDDA